MTVLSDKQTLSLSNKFQPLQNLIDTDYTIQDQDVGGWGGCGHMQMHQDTSKKNAPIFSRGSMSLDKEEHRPCDNLPEFPHVKEKHRVSEHALQASSSAQETHEKNAALLQATSTYNNRDKSNCEAVTNRIPTENQNYQEDNNTVQNIDTIPLYVWQNRQYSTDYQACVHQNGNEFGYIPMNNL